MRGAQRLVPRTFAELDSAKISCSLLFLGPPFEEGVRAIEGWRFFTGKELIHVTEQVMRDLVT